MTAQELSREFNILWDNIESGSAPGVDEYEKSIFLTLAQEVLIDEYVNVFDTNERARRILAPLTVTKSLSSEAVGISITPLDSSNSKFYEKPSNCRNILQEYAIINSNRVKIIPSKLDNNNDELISPFRKPSAKRVLRYDVTDDNDTELIELITPSAISYYNFRYIKYPNSIITDTSITEDIRESTAPHSLQNPSINEIVHDDLLNLAVQLAYKAFMSGELKSQQ